MTRETRTSGTNPSPLTWNSGVSAGLGLLVLVAASGCTTGRTVGLDDLRVDGRVPATKPAGLVVVREEDEWEAGPPPYGYIRILGDAVPNWTPEMATPRGTNPLTWTFVGPRPISSEYWSGEGNAGGRVIAIAPHPTNANICYIGAASGGIWKTTDGGANWSPIGDELPILNSGAVALDPVNPDIVYYGTGEYQTGSLGDGLFRSTDAGATWTKLAGANVLGNQISAIVINPNNTQVIHLTSSGGTYRSLDGGATWSRRMIGSAASIVMHPTNPDTIYVGRDGSGVWRSTDGGGTFSRLTNGMPTSGFGLVDVVISRSNPSVLYAALVSGGGLRGFYRTADGGNTWVQKTATPQFNSPQGSYNVLVGVDPSNENTVYCGGVDPRYAVAGIIKTTNGGDTWTEISDGPVQMHPDHHAIAFGPGNTIWAGNDGGIYKSTNGGTNWTNLNATLAVAQIYQLAVNPSNPARMLGGTQDNGTPERTTNSVNWPQLQAGDGGFSVFDPTTSTRRYTTYVYLSIYRWSSGSSRNITGPWGSDPANFIAPLVGDPSSSTTLLGGTNRVWRTTNSTTTTPTWTAISGTDVAGGGTLNAIAVAPTSSSTIYTGSTTGRVYVTTNASTWTNRTAGLPSGEVADIVISPTNAQVAYVSFFNTSGARVLRTDNGGATWSDRTGTLPAGVSARALAIDWDWPGQPGMYVGSGSGVYVSLNGGATWIKDDQTLPNVNVGDLVIDRASRAIAAGTYGRGAWRSALPTPCPADFDGDGFVDFFDFDAYVLCFEGLSCPPGKTADFDGDGFVDFFDFDQFVNAFESGC